MNFSKKIIVTGASGLIGREIVIPLKKEGFEIYSLYNNNIFHNDIKNIKCNLFNEDEIKQVFSAIKPEYLLNLAWCTTEDYLVSDLNYKFLEAGKNLLKYFKENHGKKAVFAGTCFEYDFKNTPLKEYDKLNPKTLYAQCKNNLRIYSEKFCAENDIDFAYGRIFYVYGKNEHSKRLTAYIINNLKNNQEVVIKNGNLVKDYMYTKDIAGAFVKILASDIQGCVNVCTGNGISLKDYACLYAKILGKEQYLKVLNEETSQPPLIVGDNSRLINEAGYKIRYSPEEAVKDLLLR